jgi:hypothetical protein
MRNQQPVGLARVEQREDVRIVQVRCGLDLGEGTAAPTTAASSGFKT